MTLFLDLLNDTRRALADDMEHFGLTQDEAASLIGIPRTTFGDFLVGDVERPRWLCKAIAAPFCRGRIRALLERLIDWRRRLK